MLKRATLNTVKIRPTPGTFGTLTTPDVVNVTLLSGDGAGAVTMPVWIGVGPGIIFQNYAIDESITELQITAGAPGFAAIYTEMPCR